MPASLTFHGPDSSLTLAHFFPRMYLELQSSPTWALSCCFFYPKLFLALSPALINTLSKKKLTKKTPSYLSLSQICHVLAEWALRLRVSSGTNAVTEPSQASFASLSSALPWCTQDQCILAICVRKKFYFSQTAGKGFICRKRELGNLLGLFTLAILEAQSQRYSPRCGTL